MRGRERERDDDTAKLSSNEEPTDVRSPLVSTRRPRCAGRDPAVGVTAAQSLEEETRRPPGTSSLHDDSERMRGDAGEPATNSLDNDSMELRGHTPDQDGTNSLDDGSLDGGDNDDDNN